MSTKRIDFVARNGTIRPRIIRGWFKETEDENSRRVFISKNWTVVIGNEKIHFECRSQSRSFNEHTKREFDIELREGSLFMYNSTSTWYWYFRKKDIQDFLDKRGISKIVSIKPNTIIKLTQMQLIGKNSDGKFEILPSTIKRYESFSYWKTNFVEMTSITPTILVNNNMLPKNTSIIISDVFFNMDKFLLVKNREGHETLYVNKGIDNSEVDRYIDNNPITYTIPKPILNKELLDKFAAL